MGKTSSGLKQKRRIFVWSFVLLLAFSFMCLTFFCNTPTTRSSQVSRQHHQVFLNFRGELRYGFVSHLVEAFERHGINFFIDTREERGKDMRTLFKRIEDSTIALAIFSVRYGESGWCLDELVKIMERVRVKKLRVIPIFIKVEPRDVKKQKGDFGRRFWGLARNSRGEKINKWKEALSSAATKMGMRLGSQSYENDFIEEIVTEIKRVEKAIELAAENR